MGKQINGWIKLDRKLLDWEWFDSPNTLSVWIYLLLNANIEATTYKGKPVPRGSCVASIPQISKKCGISEKAVRTALLHLKRADQVAVSKSQHFSVISVLTYDTYQGKGQSGRQSRGQSKGQSLIIEKKSSLQEDKKGDCKEDGLKPSLSIPKEKKDPNGGRFW